MTTGDSRAPARSVAELLDRTYGEHADRPALFWAEDWLTFGQVAHLASGIHALLRELGAVAGDRVLVHMENSALARLVDHALLGSGLVRAALSPRLHVREVASIAHDADAAVVCCTTAQEAELTDALKAVGSRTRVLAIEQSEAQLRLIHTAAPDHHASPSVDGSDAAMLIYSSGTTGDPKGVIVSHDAWLAQTANALAHLPTITNADVVVLAAPMAHFGGSIGLDCMTHGARTIVLERFDPRLVADTVVRHRATILPLVPTLLSRLVDELGSAPDPLPTLRSIPYGGSPSAAGMLLRAARSFPGALTQFYGLAEALAPLTVLSAADHDRAVQLAKTPTGVPDALHLLETAGRWVTGIDHREDEGSVRVRGDVVMTGYWNRPDLTAEVLHDGWFTTGDLGDTDEQGYLRILGRTADVIISGGYNVYPREVERVIEDIPGIADVAVVGLPDPVWGEGVAAFVVLKQGTSFASVGDGHTRLVRAIREACLLRIASYKKPVAVHVLPSLPRNAAGKVDRARLREPVRPARPDHVHQH